MENVGNLQEAIKRISNRRVEDKFSLHYMLRSLNHKKYFYTYIESYKRDELLKLVIEEISTPEGWEKFVKFNTYKDLATPEAPAQETKTPVKDPNFINYDKLMSLDPTIYDTLINELGQEIVFVEHPLKGDETFVIAVCHALKIARYTDFFETTDMLQDHKEYQPYFKDGQLLYDLSDYAK